MQTNDKKMAISVFPTGVLSLDHVMGTGGLPLGHIVEFRGQKESGKNAVIYHVLAEAQRLGAVCAFIGCESALDRIHAAEIGLNVDKLLISRPRYVKEALETVDMLTRTGAADLLVVDGLAALKPSAEFRFEADSKAVRLKAQMVSEALPALARRLEEKLALCLFTTEVEEAGSTSRSSVGRALTRYSTQRLDFRRVATYYQDGPHVRGDRVAAKVVKNTLAARGGETEFDIDRDEGISKSGCVLDLALEHDIVLQLGGCYHHNGKFLGRGRSNVKDRLDESPGLRAQIERRLCIALGIDREHVVGFCSDELGTRVVARPLDAGLLRSLSEIERELDCHHITNRSKNVAVIPTGALSLDIALGIGGWARGRIAELFGTPSSGTTTLAYHAIAEAQRLGGVCAFIDVDNKIDWGYAEGIGVDIGALLAWRPRNGEQALELADRLVRWGVDLVVVDSIAALTPSQEMRESLDRGLIDQLDRLMDRAMRKLVSDVGCSQAVCLFTNQIRDKVGVRFGSPETQPGGWAPKFFSSQRVDLRIIEKLRDDDDEEVVGQRVRAKVIKAMLAAPHREAKLDIHFGTGVSAGGCAANIAIEHEIVAWEDSSYSFCGVQMGRCYRQMKHRLDEHVGIRAEIERRICETVGLDRHLIAGS